MTEREAAEYEIAGSFWAGMGGVLLPDWACTLSAKWFDFKVRRKYARYVEFMEFRATKARTLKKESA